MSLLLEMLSPSFLLRDALVGSVLVGAVCPLVGVYFVLRRMIFLGVALPQLSAAGIAFAFLLHRFLAGPHVAGQLSEPILARIGDLAFPHAGILILDTLERSRRQIRRALTGCSL